MTVSNKKHIKGVLQFRWAIFGVLALAYFFVYFHRLSLSVVADNLVKDFETSASVIGLLGSVYFYCYALMQFPAGLLSDSIGPRRTVTFFLLIAAAGSILFGFSPNIEIAFAGRILVGFGVSMVFIPTMKILSQWFRKHEFALMAGILNAVGGIGVLAGTWVLALMTVSFGWRFSFELIGICTFVIVILAWLIVRDNPRDKGWPTIAEIEQSESNDAKQPVVISLMEGARRVVSEKYFWPVAAWFFFDCGIFFGFGGLWGGPYLIHVYGMSRAEAGTVLSMIAWGMIIGSPLLGLVSDRLLKSRKKPFIICTLILAIEMLMLYLSSRRVFETDADGHFFYFFRLLIRHRCHRVYNHERVVSRRNRGHIRGNGQSVSFSWRCCLHAPPWAGYLTHTHRRITTAIQLKVIQHCCWFCLSLLSLRLFARF